MGSESIPCIVTTLLYLDAKSFIVFSLVEELKSSSLTIILLLVAFSFVLPKCLSFFLNDKVVMEAPHNIVLVMWFILRICFEAII